MSVLSMAVALYFGGVSFGILGDFVRRNEVWAERQYGLVFLITGGAILYGARLRAKMRAAESGR